jgi:ketosteroid isomerase-like protein
VVELWFYTPAVGGSIPSAPTSEIKDVSAATHDVLAHHLECFGKVDLAGTMADYTDASRFFTPHRLLRGSEAIRRFFAVLFEEFEKPGMSFELLRQEVCGYTAYIVWTAETADSRFEVGTDTFIVQNGKILTQSFAGKISPKH